MFFLNVLIMSCMSVFAHMKINIFLNNRNKDKTLTLRILCCSLQTIIEQALLEVCPELKDPRLLEHLEEEERKLQEQRKKAAEEAAAKKKEEDKEEMVTKTDEEVGEEVDENNTKEDSGASETREGFDDEDNQDASDEDEDDDDDAPKGLEENGLDTEDGELSNKENTSIEDLGPREDGVGGPD